MKEHVIRLLPGEDILVEIDHYCKKHNIEAAYIGTCVGSLSRVSFRKGDTRTLLTLKGPFEIVSMVGTVSKGGNHIHVSVSGEDFMVKGGHLVSGSIIQSTAELVLIELEEYEMSRSVDVQTGYKTLKIEEIRAAKSTGH